ncbi:MAG: zf-HC2 domain-containing protein [Chloroflexi bacterium]|nr:zf-HC2 domain-containing protein [Chloroflexota bacterium]
MKHWLETIKRGMRPGNRARLAPLPPTIMRKVARQVEMTDEVEYTCDDVLRLLDQFAEAVLRGEDAAKLMPLVQKHLDMCPDCREEFEALLRILRASPSDASPA